MPAVNISTIFTKHTPVAVFSPALSEACGTYQVYDFNEESPTKGERRRRSIQNTWNVDLSGHFLCTEGILPCKLGVHTQPKKTTNSFGAQFPLSTIQSIYPVKRTI